MTDAPWTIGRLLTWTTDFLRDKGADSPQLDAQVLLSHAKGCTRIQLYTIFDEVAPDALREKFRALVKERAAGKPVAYLVGQREFFSLPFDVTPDVLIPRPETETLVVRALDLAKERGAASGELKIADVGTGSGILAVTLAKRLPKAHVMAIDVSPKALAVAQRNAEKHAVVEQVTFLEGDVLAGTPATPTFDLIVSNPPYVLSSEMAMLPDDVKKFEPALALDGGEQGTTVIERLLPHAAERLRPGGWLLIEIGPRTAARTESLVDETPGLKRHPTLKDLAKLPRIVQAQREDQPRRENT
jgi:release factor glutamine methyltransferase